MIRFLPIVLLLMLVGCAEQSKGVALNECRLKYYLESTAAQGQLVPNCMTQSLFR
jgi:hypothetical protein